MISKGEGLLISSARSTSLSFDVMGFMQDMLFILTDALGTSLGMSQTSASMCTK